MSRLLTTDLLDIVCPFSSSAFAPMRMVELGHGGFGSVFLAKTTTNHLVSCGLFIYNFQVAVKKVPHETTRQKRKNFQEVRFLRYFRSHPNIVKYHAAGIGDEEMWIITEYLCGGTLTEVIFA